MFTPVTYADFLTDITIQSRNTGKWSEDEIRFCINRGVREWANKVWIPFTYEFEYHDTRQTYDLPRYIPGSFQVQYQDDNEDWCDVRVYSVDFGSNGTRQLRLTFMRGGGRAGRVNWWGRNGIAPLTDVVLLAGIDTDDTTLTFTSDETVDDVGVVKLDDEWIQYSGRSFANGITTLTNLVRGAYSTTAASHDADEPILFGFVIDRSDLLQQLSDYVFMQLYVLSLRHGSSTERQTYEAMLNYHMTQANAYWRRYTSKRPINSHLHPEGVGEPLDYKRMYPASGDRWRYS